MAEARKEHKTLKISGIICLVISFFLLLQITTGQSLSFATDIAGNQNISKTKLYPSRLVIKDIDIQIPILPGIIENGTWPVTSKGATYLASSVSPGEIGNSIIYGHNWPNLLGRLSKVKAGQEIEVVFTDGSVKKFIVQFTQEVTPDQVYVLNQTDDRRLTLYTCIGFLDNKRFVVTAILQEGY